MKTWFQRSKKERAQIKESQRQCRELVRRLKDRPCVDCGQKYAPDVMDFDHVPDRGGKLGRVAMRGSVPAILAEARKCDVVCSNCHRIRTRRRRIGAKLKQRERDQRLDGIVAAVEREREALRGL